jgi:hypothetical protein
MSLLETRAEDTDKEDKDLMSRLNGRLVLYVTLSVTLAAVSVLQISASASSVVLGKANVELRHSPLPAPNPGDDPTTVAHSPLPAPNPGDDPTTVAHSPLPAPNPGDDPVVNA